MTKPTSKSASAIQKTSSPSGTSDQTDATVAPLRKIVKVNGRFAHVVAHIQALTKKEFRESLIASGIISKSGQLTEHYRTDTQKKTATAASNVPTGSNGLDHHANPSGAIQH